MRSLQSYPTLQIDDGLVIALSHILERFGKSVDVIDIAKRYPSLDWRGIAGVATSVVPDETADVPGWPHSPNAIVKFNRSRIDGHKDAFYCAVSDAVNRLIIDSRDGNIKR